jgi:hypothetical protein
MSLVLAEQLNVLVDGRLERAEHDDPMFGAGRHYLPFLRRI